MLALYQALAWGSCAHLTACILPISTPCTHLALLPTPCAHLFSPQVLLRPHTLEQPLHQARLLPTPVHQHPTREQHQEEPQHLTQGGRCLPISSSSSGRQP